MYPNGEVSQAVDRLQPGDKIALKGPFGKFVYKSGKYKAIGVNPPCPLLTTVSPAPCALRSCSSMLPRRRASAPTHPMLKWPIGMLSRSGLTVHVCSLVLRGNMQARCSSIPCIAWQTGLVPCSGPPVHCAPWTQGHRAGALLLPTLPCIVPNTLCP